MPPRKKPAEVEKAPAAVVSTAVTDACKKFFLRREAFPTERLLTALRGTYRDAFDIVTQSFRDLMRDKAPEYLAGGLVPTSDNELTARYCLVTALRFRPGLLPAWHACGPRPSQPVLNLLRNALRLESIRKLDERIAESPALSIISELLMAPIEVDGFPGSVEAGKSVFKAWVKSEQMYNDMRILAQALGATYVRIAGNARDGQLAWYTDAFPFNPEIIKPVDGATVPTPANERLPGPQRATDVPPGTIRAAAAPAGAAPGEAGTIAVDVIRYRQERAIETVLQTVILRGTVNIPMAEAREWVRSNGITTPARLRNWLQAKAHEQIDEDDMTRAGVFDRNVERTEQDEELELMRDDEYDGASVTSTSALLTQLRSGT